MNDILDRYAELSQQKVFVSLADLGASDRVAPEMLAWSREHRTCVVLANGWLLTSAPGSRDVQNCKIVMNQKEMTCTTVIPASGELLELLLADKVSEPTPILEPQPTIEPPAPLPTSAQVELQSFQEDLAEAYPLSDLGYTPTQIHLLQKSIQSPQGVVIISGPSDSGKSTTLASCLALIDPSRKKPSTIEVNDKATTQTLLNAAITGHLVFATMSASSAINSLNRLVDMGISASILCESNFLVSLVSQKLVPKLCEKCAIQVGHSSEHRTHLARWQAVFPNQMHFIKARGKSCEACDGSGILGATLIAEIIWIDRTARQFIQNGEMHSWEKSLRKNGWQSYRDHALELVRQGVCDPLDIEKIIGEINSDFNVESFNYRNLTKRTGW